MSEEATDAEKKAQYEAFLTQLRKDLGIEEMIKTMDHLLAFNKPGTENKQQPQLSDRMTEEDKKKLMDADDAIDFLDKIGSILQKYGVIEGAPSDPYMKFMSMMANNHMEFLQWQLGQNYREFQQMKRAKEHDHH